MPALTKFQQREILYDQWLAGGEQGLPPERPVFRGFGVSAMVDPFSTRRYGAVIYPHEPKRHLSELAPSVYAKVGLVARAVGQRILFLTGEAVRPQEEVPEQRATGRVDGFEIPMHCHFVIAASMKDEAPVVLPEDPEERAAELDRRWEALRLPDAERSVLEDQLWLVDKIAARLDTSADIPQNWS